jgi:hypothetical protein
MLSCRHDAVRQSPSSKTHEVVTVSRAAVIRAAALAFAAFAKQVLGACTLNQLDDAQALWARAGIANYEFTVSQYGFVVPGDIRVKVRGGMPRSVTWLSRDRRWPNWTHHVSRRIWHTLPLTAADLFSLVREHIRRYSGPSASIDCSFDPHMGFLGSMSADDTSQTDALYSVATSDFRLLK